MRNKTLDCIEKYME